MWISTPDNIIQTDHFATFEIVPIEDLSDPDDFAIEGRFASRDASAIVFSGSHGDCLKCKEALQLSLRNGDAEPLEKFIRDERDAQYAKDTDTELDPV